MIGANGSHSFAAAPDAVRVGGSLGLSTDMGVSSEPASGAFAEDGTVELGREQEVFEVAGGRIGLQERGRCLQSE